MVSVCIITVWKIIRNGTSSQDSSHFFVHSSQLILLCTTFFLLSSTKSVKNATYIQIPCQKSINPFKMVTTSFCSCNKFLNDDVGQATKAAEATQLFVEGKDVEEYYWVDYVKVTTENAAQYL